MKIDIVENKCTKCGARLKIKNDEASVTCEYCGAVYLIEKQTHPPEQTPLATPPISQPTYPQPPMPQIVTKNIPPKPKFNIIIFIFLCFIPFMAFIYLISSVISIINWNSKYGNIANKTDTNTKNKRNILY